MQNLNFRYYNARYLVLFILIIGTFISLILSAILPIIGNSLNYYQFPATGLIVIGFLILINKYLWKLRWFAWLINVPNLQGRYKGAIHFTHPIDHKKASMECVMTIRQTASKIVVRSFFIKENGDKSTISVSKVANIVKNEDDTYSLIFTYENIGNGDFQPHYGTNVLKFIKNDRVLNGTYYTDRIPQTRGEIGVEYVNDELYQEF